jgi:guanylate kinase
MTVSIRSLAKRPLGTIFIVSAPSGAGKTTLSNQLLEVLPDMGLSVSYTTRLARAGEVPGKDYHFVPQAVFEQMREAGEFAEWAEVHGRLYGTPRRTLEKQIQRGQDVLLDIDVQGAVSIKRSFRSSVLIFVLPPSLDELRRRLAARGTDRADTIRRRLANARREMQEIHRYDYAVINRSVDEAVSKLKAIVIAERLKICRFKSTQR